MVDFESSKEQIANLVDEFKANEHYFKSVSFDEENTKINFINKFFIALGWDVYNDAGVAPQYKDVEFEDTVLVSGKPKNPDYSFRVGGTRKFFVEAKAPHVNVENSKEYAFQLKRYTWSGKLSVGLLTDFEELSIYVPKSAPKLSHHPKTDRIKYYKYTDYVENWEEIYNIYSKEAVLSGKFDNYFSDKDIDGKNPTSSVDSEFLKTIEEWRLILARNIALRNKELEVEELNYAVQLIIDRIIFLRIAEDRGIERYGKLKKLLDLAENNIDECPVYEGFIELCKKADAKYNSGLFHFTEEEGINLDADTLTPTLHVDDGTLKKIIKGLYYPDCPYEFSMISTEILGNIYEQFLGKVIRLTDAHHAKVEDKPEVKKAGGVYYTPQYIVNYIVDNTIGELLKGKTPNKVSELKIVDPACGSGSFLLGAYQKLLDWHVDYYSNLNQPPKNVIYTDKKGIIRLTIQEKKRILLNNIYGVDIDSQAVEVTKLSLLLKVLEDENKDVLEAQQKLIQERALPYLGDNIKCGNSLIGTEILEQEELSVEEISTINPFVWEEEFSEIFAKGGFDVVIGNPPYIRIHLLDKKSKNYYKNNYVSSTGIYDIYTLFVEKAIAITKNAFIGFIIPNKFIETDYGKGMREVIKEKMCLRKIINFKDNQIFQNASTYTCLLFLKLNSMKFKYSEIEQFNNKTDLKLINQYDEYDDGNISIGILNKDVYDTLDWKFFIGESASIIEKMMSHELKLKDICEKIFVGLQTSADKVYIVEKISEKEGLVEIYSKMTNQNHFIEKDLLKTYIKGKEINRYQFNYKNKLLLFPYYLNEDSFEIIPIKDLKNKYPNAWDYLKINEKVLKERESGKMKIKNWYAFTYPKSMLDYREPKIMTPNSAFNSSFSFDKTGQYYVTTGVAGGYCLKLNKEYLFDELYLLAILNSNLMTFLNKKIGKSLRGKYYSYEGRVIGNYPIIELSIQEQYPFIELSDKMLDLNKQLQNVKTPKQKGLLEKQIKVTDKKINQLVYELYDLTDEEIEIVESSLN